MTEPDPFAVLGIEPTLELARVKQAYFAGLTRHPPHQDAEGFRRLRTAYETLTAPGGLAAAFLAAPLDVATELARYSQRFDAATEAAARQQQQEQESAQTAGRLIETVSRLSWAEALKRFGLDENSSSESRRQP